MLRTLIAGIIATGFFALGLGSIATAQAAPKHCHNHGTGHGQIYKAGCAKGSGGLGAIEGYMSKNDDGTWSMKHERRKDTEKRWNEARKHAN